MAAQHMCGVLCLNAFGDKEEAEVFREIRIRLDLSLAWNNQ